MTTPPAVDDLHMPESDNPWITETAWYSFWTPGGEYIAHVYLRFRPNLGIVNPCIYVWGSGASVEWDAAYWKHSHYPMPKSLVDLELRGGLTHRVTEPFVSYEIAYRDEKKYGPPLSFDIQVSALAEPDYFGGKHFDQRVRVTGVLDVDGHTFQIDCHAMRDRSWYSRGDYTLFRSAYSYAVVDGENNFLAMFAAPRDRDMLIDDLPLVGGYVGFGGTRRPASVGERRVTRRDRATGHPAEVVLTVDGEAIVGQVLNTMAVAANPNMLSWMGLVEWDYRGRAVLGEDQEIWSPSIWHAFRRGETP